MDASRPITAQEQGACAGNKVDFIELPVARDAITVIVNARNTWAESMTVAELRTLWAPEADKKVTKWSQVRQGWPNEDIRLFAPGAESGTFDYFTAAINGGARASRKDYMASGDDSTIINGVAADEFALGYVGYGYYERAKDRLKSVGIDDLDDSIGQGAIQPSPQNVGRGVYRPLSRILFIYVNNARVERPEVRALVDDYLRHAGERAAQVGTIALMSNVYDLARQRFTRRRTGSMYGSPSAAELGIEYPLTQSQSKGQPPSGGPPLVYDLGMRRQTKHPDGRKDRRGQHVPGRHHRAARALDEPRHDELRGAAEDRRAERIENREAARPHGLGKRFEQERIDGHEAHREHGAEGHVHGKERHGRRLRRRQDHEGRVDAGGKHQTHRDEQRLPPEAIRPHPEDASEKLRDIPHHRQRGPDGR